jgi:Tol biopolymer transport system component/DNA-binding winged helix-turn-helix (wHTH) protein
MSRDLAGFVQGSAVRIQFGPFTLDFETRQLSNAGRAIHLEPKAFDLLSALVLERPKALSKADLQERLWPGTFVSEANLSNLVAEVRAALGDPARAPRFVRTVHGFGYAFSGEATSWNDAHEPATVESGNDLAPVAPVPRRPSRTSRVAWLALAALALGLITTAAVARRRDGAPTSTVIPARFTIAPPENASFGGPSRGGSGSATQVAISPDGRQIVFVARGNAAYQLWLRPLAVLDATPIPGTDGAAFPFWSPDSRSIGFFADGKLKTVPIAGGPPTVLADAPLGNGGSWNRQNVILFSPGTSRTGLVRVSSGGGSVTAATTLEATTREDSHRWPHFLPDGRHFFYTAVTGPCCPAGTPSEIRIGSLDQPGHDVPLFQAESSVSYASGHLIYARDEVLMAQPFDASSRRLLGDAFPLAERVTREGSRYVGASASENGVLVYGQGRADVDRQLTWFDRAGHVLGTIGDPARYAGLALAPDDRRVAVTLETGTQKNVDIWLIDLARNIRSRLTVHPGQDVSPVWSPDGKRIAFQSTRLNEPVAIRQTRSHETGTDESLLAGPGNFTMAPTSWSSDARYIAYVTKGSDLWILPLFGDRKPFAFADSPFTELSGVFSPDGRWIAYTSNENGQADVYVQAFPGPGVKVQVSRNGGSHPAWRGDGRELFYLGQDGVLTAVAIAAGRALESGPPQALFQTNVWNRTFNQVYAVTRDGQRFLVNALPPSSRSSAPIAAVLDWTAAFHR